jgi:hypothetical protein
MKKFGTPIGAAPGRANEKVGLDEVGVPPLLRSEGVLVGFVVGLPLLPVPVLPVPVLPPELFPELPP